MESIPEECTEEEYVSTPRNTFRFDSFKLGDCTSGCVSDCCQTSSYTSSPTISPSPTFCTFSPLSTTVAKPVVSALSTPIPYATAASSLVSPTVFESPTLGSSSVSPSTLHRSSTVPDLLARGRRLNFSTAKDLEPTPTKAPSTPASRSSSIMKFINRRSWNGTLGSTGGSLQSTNSLIAAWDCNTSPSLSTTISPTVLPRSGAPGIALAASSCEEQPEELQSDGGSSIPSDLTTESMEEDVQTFVLEHLEKTGGGPIPAFTLYNHMMIDYYCELVTNISYERFLRCLTASAELGFQFRDTGQLACYYRWRHSIPDDGGETDEGDFSCSECIEEESYDWY